MKNKMHPGGGPVHGQLQNPSRNEYPRPDWQKGNHANCARLTASDVVVRQAEQHPQLAQRREQAIAHAQEGLLKEAVCHITGSAGAEI